MTKASLNLVSRLDSLVGQLSDYEAAEDQPEIQIRKFEELKGIFPKLDFSSRLEPRTVLRGELENWSSNDIELFEDEVAKFIQRNRRSATKIATLLSLLEESQLEIRISTIFSAAEILQSMLDVDQRDQAAANLISIVQLRDPIELISLVHRLAKLKATGFSVVNASLLALARRFPVSLGEGFREFASVFATDEFEPQVLAVTLSEVAEIAGPLPLIAGLKARSPSANGKLCLAAFGYDLSPFKMVQGIGSDPDVQSVEVLWRGECVPIQSISDPASADQWLAEVSAAMRNTSRQLAEAKPIRRTRLEIELLPRELGRPSPHDNRHHPEASSVNSLLRKLWQLASPSYLEPLRG